MPPKNFAINVTDKPTPDSTRTAVLKDPGFGTAFTDHMVTMKWTSERKWHAGRLDPYRPFQLDPATAALHYGQIVFEGLKAYRGAEHQMLLFRPEENAERLAKSAQRMAIPPLPSELFVEAIEELVRVDHQWVPPVTGGGSLYLRPFIFASEAALKVRPAREYTFCLIASPVGDYFSGGQKPLIVWVSSDYVRAVKGGTGAAKCAGNYAASLVAQAEAAENGCDQTVFLDAIEQKWIEELGGMNICFVTKDRTLITPPLSGTILPGVTRKSILTLAAEAGLRVDEVPYSYDEWRRDAESGHVTEAFACGTAAVLVSIGTVRDAHGSFTVGDGNSIGPVTASLRQRLVNIQRGVEPDHHGWVRRIAL
jgi:branched-chain amino acid aminotransferase